MYSRDTRDSYRPLGIPTRTLRILIIRDEHHLLYLQFQSGF